MPKLKDRLAEPSTAAGVGAAIVAIGQAAGVHVPPAVGRDVVGAAEGALTGDWAVTIAALAAAAVAIFGSERKNE